jgi:hypothetical protein
MNNNEIMNNEVVEATEEVILEESDVATEDN